MFYSICIKACRTAGFILLASVSVWASGMHPMDEKEVASTDSIKGSQKLCPIRGEEVDPEAHIDYQGQRIYFCCDGCDKKFLKDPETHFLRMKERGEIAESIQKICPVSGDILTNHKVSITLPGRKIYFCCKDCIADFKKDKAKALESLEKSSQKEDSEKNSRKDHQDEY